jgi:hypothetical protein
VAALVGAGPSVAVASLVFSAWVRDAVLLRRVVAGLFSDSWLTVVAFSVFERVDRVRVVAGFSCSFVSEDSDVFVMKKTPFLHIWSAFPFVSTYWHIR